MRPGWYPDPAGRQPLRWFDGAQWTPQTLDGWQRPVLDPLPVDHPAPAPPPAPVPGTPAPPAASPPPAPVPGAAPSLAAGSPPPAPVPGAPVPPAGNPAAPPVGPAPATMGRPPAADEPTEPVFSLVWRLLAIAAAAAMMLIAFLVLPWIELEFGDRRELIRYLQFADWVNAYRVDVGSWRGAYGQGVALLMAGFGLIAACLAVLATAVQRRVPNWCFGIFLLLMVMLVLSMAGVPTMRSLDGPWEGPPVAAPGYASLLLMAAHLVLMAACPVATTAKKTKR